MTTSGIDPSRMLLTGENPFIRLAEKDNDPLTTEASFWRVIFSPAGRGHALYLVSELTNNEMRVYTDNIAMARWLQQDIQKGINQASGNTELPAIEATFSFSGDLRSYWTEHMTSRDEDISLTWYDIGEPFILHTLPGSSPQRPHGVCTVLVPAAGAQLSINGRFAKGRPFPRDRDGRKSSTCCLAFSESWTLPQ